MNRAAVFWMLGATASFSLMAVGGRELAAYFDTFEVLLYRSLLALPILAIWAARVGWDDLATRHPGRHLLRNTIHFGAQNLWFYGIAAIPLAQLVALEFTNPIWVALLAPLLLGEAMTRRRMAVVFLGFLGILIVARPGVAPLALGHAAGLGAALGFALTNMVTRRLSATESVLSILFWMTLSQAVMGLLTALPGGIAWPPLAALPWLALVGATGLTAHLCLTSALSAAPASVVGPLEFLRLPVIAILGALLYGEPLELAVLFGASVIVLANVLNLRAAQRA